MTTLERYGTSIVGWIVHTVAGLAAITSVLFLFAVVAFAAPSFVGGLGLDYLVSGGTLADNVAHLKATTVLSLPLLALGLVVSLGTFIGGRRLGTILYDIGKSASDHTASDSTPDTGRVARSPEEAYLRKFRRSNFWIGLLLVALLGTALALRALVEGGRVGSGLLDIPSGILWFAVLLFGGPFVLAGTAGVFLGVWYGLKQASTEALVVGILAWGLMGLSGLGTMSRNGSGVGLVIAGILGIYYAIRAYGATEPVTTWGKNTFAGPAQGELRRGNNVGESSTATAGRDSGPEAEQNARDGTGSSSSKSTE